MSARIEYIAFVDQQKTPGVAKKVINTVKSAENLGHDVSSKLFAPSFSSVFGFIKAVFTTQCDVLFIRFSSLLFPFLFFPLLFARLKGVKIVVDVPTPRKSVLVELKTSETNVFVRIVKQSISILSSSWVLWPANVVVQYAQDLSWYLWGVQRRTVIIGNGINIPDSLAIANSRWDKGTPLNLIAVAQLAQWHGYDRLIHAIHQFKQSSENYDIKLTIVGEGDAYAPLQSLVSELNLQDNVTFTGFLSGADLDAHFYNAHIGIASLGLYRIGLHEASVLKTREYVARGLSVIGAADDPDFAHDSQVRLMVTNSDSIEDIVVLLKDLPNSMLLAPQELRDYAEKNLTMESKLKVILAHVDIK